MPDLATHCLHCGRAWADHLGLIPTCKNLDKAVSALKVISIWAIFRGGIELNPEDVQNLIRKTFDEIGVEHG